MKIVVIGGTGLSGRRSWPASMRRSTKAARTLCRPRRDRRRSPTTPNLGRRTCGVVGCGAHGAERRVTDLRITHIGGPTTLIEVGGWRLLTDPTFDPPGRKYAFGWGTGSVKLAGPAIAAPDLGPIDAVLLTHDHHDDNLDSAGRALLPSAGVVFTTVSGAKRLGSGARGLEAWGTTRLESPGSRRSRSRPRLAATARR